jgi:C4-dicarboxylate-specific signal transduction histidine kinase
MEHKGARIYIVDDEPLVLTSLRHVVEMETPHTVRTFTVPDEALEAMRVDPPDVVISDLTMPGMDGTTLLARARALVPDAARIVLTGHADKDSAIRAINTAGIYQLIEKPWDNARLLVTLGNAVDHVALTRRLHRTIAELSARNAELEHTLAELRDAQDRLVGAERLAAVGRLATGIAHEIGNQQSLLGFAELIADRYKDDPEARTLTDPLLAARRRMAAMIASIKEFVRGAGNHDYSREAQPLAPILDETLAILRFEPAMKTRAITRAPWQEDVRAVVNREKILQVALNLMRNALQATREGGKIRVGLYAAEGRVRIEVQDDGCGIAPEHLERIWEPFFSTKGEGGTGLGLGICRRIVEEHGGTIRVHSALGRGATFTVELPSP